MKPSYSCLGCSNISKWFKKRMKRKMLEEPSKSSGVQGTPALQLEQLQISSSLLPAWHISRMSSWRSIGLTTPTAAWKCSTTNKRSQASAYNNCSNRSALPAPLPFPLKKIGMDSKLEVLTKAQCHHITWRSCSQSWAKFEKRLRMKKKIASMTPIATTKFICRSLVLSPKCKVLVTVETQIPRVWVRQKKRKSMSWSPKTYWPS